MVHLCLRTSIAVFLRLQQKKILDTATRTHCAGTISGAQPFTSKPTIRLISHIDYWGGFIVFLIAFGHQHASTWNCDNKPNESYNSRMTSDRYFANSTNHSNNYITFLFRVRQVEHHCRAPYCPTLKDQQKTICAVVKAMWKWKHNKLGMCG